MTETPQTPNPNTRSTTPQTEIVHNPFPADPEERLNAILCAINTEPKSILIAKCLDGNFRGQYDLTRLYREWADWPKGKGSIGAYCHRTLTPIGLIAEERATIFESPLVVELAWKLTPEGLEYGPPITGYAIRLACEKNISLHQIFGSTASGGESRSPGNSASILKLLHHGKRHVADLAEYLNLNHSVVSNHLRKLEEAGLVIFDSVNAEGKWSKYAWLQGKTPEDVPDHKLYPVATQRVAQELSRLGISNYHEIAEKLKICPSTVSHILAHIADAGFAHRKWEKRSDTVITEMGEDVVRFIYDLEEALDNGQSLSKMKEELHQTTPDMTYAAAELYRRVSPRKNQKTPEEWVTGILDFVDRYTTANGFGPRPTEIAHGIGSNIKSISNYLRPLMESGVLSKERDGPAVRYRRPTPECSQNEQ